MEDAARAAKETMAAESANSLAGRLRARLLKFGMASLERFYKLIGNTTATLP